MDCWKIQHWWMVFPILTSIHTGFPIAMFHYRRVILVLASIAIYRKEFPSSNWRFECENHQWGTLYCHVWLPEGIQIYRNYHPIADEISVWLEVDPYGMPLNTATILLGEIIIELCLPIELASFLLVFNYHWAHVPLEFPTKRHQINKSSGWWLGQPNMNGMPKSWQPFTTNQLF